jgi:hypothetical protein
MSALGCERVCEGQGYPANRALAVVIDGVIQVGEVNPDTLFSPKGVENAVAVTEWSPVSVWTAVFGVAGIALLGIACIGDMAGLRKLVSFLGGVVCVGAWVTGCFSAPMRSSGSSGSRCAGSPARLRRSW